MADEAKKNSLLPAPAAIARIFGEEFWTAL
jgi:hypothetical protein